MRTQQSYQHIISFQRFKVISITVMPPSDFGLLEIVQPIKQQITPFKLVIKQHSIAATVNTCLVQKCPSLAITSLENSYCSVKEREF